MCVASCPPSPRSRGRRGRGLHHKILVLRTRMLIVRWGMARSDAGRPGKLCTRSMERVGVGIECAARRVGRACLWLQGVGLHCRLQMYIARDDVLGNVTFVSSRPVRVCVMDRDAVVRLSPTAVCVLGCAEAERSDRATTIAVAIRYNNRSRQTRSRGPVTLLGMGLRHAAHCASRRQQQCP
jgi:hypothetical protein